MSRYENVDENVYQILNSVKREHFPELANAEIKILFDTKKKTSGGKIVIARIQKTNDLLKYLTSGDIEDGYDYIMYIDKKIWNNIDNTDRVRIIRHELRHTLVDLDSRNSPYKIVDHDISDFHQEIELNKDDPRWCDRVGELGRHLYDQEREMNE